METRSREVRQATEDRDKEQRRETGNRGWETRSREARQATEDGDKEQRHVTGNRDCRQ
jgi:hypothetical protein